MNRNNEITVKISVPQAQVDWNMFILSLPCNMGLEKKCETWLEFQTDNTFR
jgi:hypothetical protein